MPGYYVILSCPHEILQCDNDSELYASLLTPYVLSFKKRIRIINYFFALLSLTKQQKRSQIGGNSEDICLNFSMQITLFMVCAKTFASSDKYE